MLTVKEWLNAFQTNRSHILARMRQIYGEIPSILAARRKLYIKALRASAGYYGGGFFKTARLGVEDTLTLFSRQTLPIDGKGTVKG